MLIEHIRSNNFGYTVVDDFYTNQELDILWGELKYFTSPNRFFSPDMTFSATDEGELLKNNKSVPLDHFYQNNRRMSDILRLNRKLFDTSIFEGFSNLHPYNQCIKECSLDYTLLSYYENGDYYNSHKDLSQFTALTWIYKEPKMFSGGEFSFPEDGVELEIKNNRMVLFPSWASHKVSEVFMDQDQEYTTDGRYCITQFLCFSSGY